MVVFYLLHSSKVHTASAMKNVRQALQGSDELIGSAQALQGTVRVGSGLNGTVRVGSGLHGTVRAVSYTHLTLPTILRV